METAALDSSPASTSRLQRVFDVAVDAYGSEDVELWLQYALFKQNTSKSAGSVYWKATKALAQPEEFIALFKAAST